MTGLRNIHWMAPSIMLSSFVCGVALAVAHHVFNASLEGKLVPTGQYHPLGGLPVSKQQFNSSMGITFAFFVRTFLAIAASATYVQVLWQSIRNRQAPTLAELDWAFAALDNFFGLFNFKRGRKYPILVVLAIVFWCVPFATIFPPATLLVELQSTLPTRMLEVPMFDFTTMDFTGTMQNAHGFDESPLDDWRLHGASQPLQNIALAATGLGTVLPIQAPAPNASWSQDFWGPTLQCHDADMDDRDRIFVNIWNSYEDTDMGSHGFLSWVSWSWDNAFDLYLDRIEISSIKDELASIRDLPFIPLGSFWRPTTGLSPSLVAGNGRSSLWLAVIPQAPHLHVSGPYGLHDGSWFKWLGPEIVECDFQSIQNVTDEIACAYDNGVMFAPARVFEDATLLRCDLLNTSYSVDFKYTNGIQNINVDLNRTGQSPVINGSAGFLSQNPQYQGSIPEGCSTFLADPNMDGTENEQCTFHLDAVRLLSYQSISAAFNQLILGSIYYKFDPPSKILRTSDVLRTVLGQTRELAWLPDWNVLPSYGVEAAGLQDAVSKSSAWAFQGLSNPRLPLAPKDLESTLEELFQNLTLSLLAEPYFQPNFSSPFAPAQLTNVTLETWQNVYSYNRATLWIAYGLAIGSTALAVAGGIAALLSNGASYSNKFSTILRASRTAGLGVDVAPEDGGGQDPLQKYLQLAQLYLKRKPDRESTYDLLETPNERRSLTVERKSHDQ